MNLLISFLKCLSIFGFLPSLCNKSKTLCLAFLIFFRFLNRYTIPRSYMYNGYFLFHKMIECWILWNSCIRYLPFLLFFSFSKHNLIYYTICIFFRCSFFFRYFFQFRIFDFYLFNCV